jgi:hypothetical protein
MCHSRGIFFALNLPAGMVSDSLGCVVQSCSSKSVTRSPNAILDGALQEQSEQAQWRAILSRVAITSMVRGAILTPPAYHRTLGGKPMKRAALYARVSMGVTARTQRFNSGNCESMPTVASGP